MGDTLTEGQKLEKGESLTSSNGAYTLTLQDDGNLVLAARGQAVWATGTDGQDVVRAEVQTDGNFVLYTPDKPVWHTDTKGKKEVKLRPAGRPKPGAVCGRRARLVDRRPTPRKRHQPSPKPRLPKSLPAAVEEPAPAPAPEPEAAAAPPPPPPPPPPPAPRTYTVVSGDTLWAISERFYGDGSKYQVIADASGVSNPDLIHPGQVLTIP